MKDYERLIAFGDVLKTLTYKLMVIDDQMFVKFGYLTPTMNQMRFSLVKDRKVIQIRNTLSTHKFDIMWMGKRVEQFNTVDELVKCVTKENLVWERCSVPAKKKTLDYIKKQ